jgi:hypothetical protein
LPETNSRGPFADPRGSQYRQAHVTEVCDRSTIKEKKKTNKDTDVAQDEDTVNLLLGLGGGAGAGDERQGAQLRFVRLQNYTDGIRARLLKRSTYGREGKKKIIIIHIYVFYDYDSHGEWEIAKTNVMQLVPWREIKRCQEHDYSNQNEKGPCC